MNEDVTQSFEVTLQINALGAHTVDEVLDAVREQLVLPLNMQIQRGECMQTHEVATNGSFICYDIVRRYGPANERFNGVALETPWTGHKDHSREEHLGS